MNKKFKRRCNPEILQMHPEDHKTQKENLVIIKIMQISLGKGII